MKNETSNNHETGNLQQGTVSRSYFHEISQEEVDKLIADKRSVGYVMENYKQPDWCNYPEALSMTMGCSYPARLYVDPSMVACASGGEAQSQSEGFYCADWNRCGAICEEQCPACKKADRAELL